ncbi:hypothetical protein ACFQ2Y_49635 [Streptomyces malaysiensis subsp. malaysiensis]
MSTTPDRASGVVHAPSSWQRRRTGPAVSASASNGSALRVEVRTISASGGKVTFTRSTDPDTVSPSRVSVTWSASASTTATSAFAVCSRETRSRSAGPRTSAA